MDMIDDLTNEEISKKFGNQFDLVNYAIHLATDMIQTGREPRVQMNTENPALLVLEEIAEGKDRFVEADKKKPSISAEETAFAMKQSIVEEDEEDEGSELLDEEEKAQEVLSD